MSEAAPGDAIERVRASFVRQSMMATLGAQLATVDVGEVHIAAEGHEGVRQQHDFVHGGLLMTLADSAAGYAALTTVPETAEVLTIEFKMNFLRPANGRIVAEGRVIRSGSRIAVCSADIYAGGDRTHVATALATFAVVMPGA